ncbi:Werner syndrome ATP-dependent helicase, partial [Favolaschia claudopus]
LSMHFVTSLTASERFIAIQAFLCLDFASHGTKAPREVQIRSVIAVKQGKDLLVRSGTGSGKTIAMILPILMLRKDAVAITIAPLRLIQDLHVSEFTKYGIPSLAINSYTPNTPELWKSIKEHTTFRHYSISPEQCGEYRGHIPKFAKLLHDPKWANKIGLLQIDEAHFIVTAGQDRGDEGAFRPAFSSLWERLRVHLLSKTPCTAFSASLPQRYMDIVMKTLRMDPANTVKVLLTTNRPNLVYATIPMKGSIKNLDNLEFLAPQPFPPNHRLPPCIVFIDDKNHAAKTERYLNSRLPADLAASRPFRKYHSSMSTHYLEKMIELFRAGEISGLIATECASNGFDVPFIRLIVKHGVTKTVAEDDQRGGRGGRNGMECLVLTIAEKWAYENLAETDPDHKPSKKEQRTEKEVISLASTKDCHRGFLARHNNDTTSSGERVEPTSFTCSNCCDHHPGFNLSHYLPDLSTIINLVESDLVRLPRRGYRPLRARATLEDAIHSWTKMTHQEDPILKTFPRDWILSDNAISRLAREKAQFFQIPRDVTDFLEEDNDWHSRYALEVLTVVRVHDMARRKTTRTRRSSDDSEEEEEVEEEESGSDVESELADDDTARTTSKSPTSSASTSRSNSPDLPEAPPLPEVSSTGRPLRRAAANHSVTGIANGLYKRAKM